jgi:ATP-dependent HslUV protease subunit HslV
MDMQKGRDQARTVHGTTVLAVRRGTELAMAADGQVTVGDVVVKHTARKIRRLFDDQVLVGFSGATADAFTLFDKFEAQLQRHGGNLRRAAVELAREWRSDKFLRELDAWLLVGGRDGVLVVSGAGDVLEPDDGVAAIGSGGAYALAAARVLIEHTDLAAPAIAKVALETAARLCIYTNDEITVDVLNF